MDDPWVHFLCHYSHPNQFRALSEWYIRSKWVPPHYAHRNVRVNLGLKNRTLKNLIQNKGKDIELEL